MLASLPDLADFRFQIARTAAMFRREVAYRRRLSLLPIVLLLIAGASLAVIVVVAHREVVKRRDRS